MKMLLDYILANNYIRKFIMKLESKIKYKVVLYILFIIKGKNKSKFFRSNWGGEKEVI